MQQPSEPCLVCGTDHATAPASDREPAVSVYDYDLAVQTVLDRLRHRGPGEVATRGGEYGATQ